ncbi:MAG TPA: hypothetical protein VMU26_01435 [Candidatus Polarisedimenticolia bacterium]|nr:hypothetical protein [Candidatus Polarisedimenticolia bacterium]
MNRKRLIFKGEAIMFLIFTTPHGQAHLLDAALASVSLSNAERSRVIEARDR